AVQREAGNLDEAEIDCGVARDVAAALQRLAHHHVVDVAGGDAGALERFTGRVLGELERGDVEQRPLASGTDRRAGRGNDDSVGHVSPWAVVWRPADYLTPVSAGSHTVPASGTAGTASSIPSNHVT